MIYFALLLEAPGRGRRPALFVRLIASRITDLASRFESEGRFDFGFTMPNRISRIARWEIRFQSSPLPHLVPC